MTLLLDSNVWIAYFEGSPRGAKVRTFIEGTEKIIISPINIAEVFRHALAHRGRGTAERIVAAMLEYAFEIPIESTLAIQAAALKHQHMLALADALIYATTQMHEATLVTSDSDFKHLAGVEYLGT